MAISGAPQFLPNLAWARILGPMMMACDFDVRSGRGAAAAQPADVDEERALLGAEGHRWSCYAYA